MASKKQIYADLKEWDFDPAQYEDLEWPELQAFYKSAAEQREASEASEASETVAPDGGAVSADSAGEDAAPEAGADDSAADPGAVVPDADDLDDEDDLDEEPESDLQEMHVLIGCDFESQGEVRVGTKVYRNGANVSIKRGQRFLVDERTAAYLKQHRVAASL